LIARRKPYQLRLSRVPKATKPLTSAKQLLARVRRELTLFNETAKGRTLTGEDANALYSRLKRAAYPRRK
jgi:hypothetical protein